MERSLRSGMSTPAPCSYTCRPRVRPGRSALPVLTADLLRTSSQCSCFQRTQHLVAGAKGTVDSIILSVGSAGVFTATVEFLKAWLQRDASRSIRVSWSESGSLQEFEVSGAALRGEAMEALTTAVRDRLAGSA